MSEVDYNLTQLRLHNVARAKRNSVALDAATRIKFRRLLDQIRQTVDTLDEEQNASCGWCQTQRVGHLLNTGTCHSGATCQSTAVRATPSLLMNEESAHSVLR